MFVRAGLAAGEAQWNGDLDVYQLSSSSGQPGTQDNTQREWYTKLGSGSFLEYQVELPQAEGRYRFGIRYASAGRCVGSTSASCAVGKLEIAGSEVEIQLPHTGDTAHRWGVVSVALDLNLTQSTNPASKMMFTVVAGDVEVDWVSIYLTPGDSSVWQLDWSDEFSDGELNRSMWQTQEDCDGGGNGELQCYADSNIQVTEGSLKLTALRQTTHGVTTSTYGGSPGNKTRQFSSGRVRSVHSVARGRVEVRAVIPSGRGLWPAIWMLPTENAYGGWAASGEIDIMEARGQDSGRVESTLHFSDKWPYNRFKGSGQTAVLDAGNDSCA